MTNQTHIKTKSPKWAVLVASVLAVLAVLVVTLKWYGNKLEKSHDEKIASMPSQIEQNKELAEITKKAVDMPKSVSKKNTAQGKAIVLAGENPDYLQLDKRLAEMSKRRGGQTFDKDAVLEAIKKPAAWAVEPSAATKLSDKYDLKHMDDGRVFLALDTLKIETLMPKDTMDIEVPQLGRTFTMVVERVEKNPLGTLSWHGKLIDFESQNTVSITQGGEKGNTITQIGIFTPEGYHVVEGFNQLGWIIPGGKLFKGGEITIPVINGTPQKPEKHKGQDDDHHH